MHFAAEAGITRQTLAKWHARWREARFADRHDRSAHPISSPRQSDPQIENPVEYPRRNLKLGPAMLTAATRRCQSVGATVARRSREEWNSGCQMRRPVS